MAKSIKIQLTPRKLELSGVQVTLTVTVDDWRRTVAISPVDYKVFKEWDEIYAKYIIDSIVEQMEHEMGEVSR
jgi:hypothetical protein